jgi:hypothetical protein
MGQSRQEEEEPGAFKYREVERNMGYIISRKALSQDSVYGPVSFISMKGVADLCRVRSESEREIIAPSFGRMQPVFRALQSNIGP